MKQKDENKQIRNYGIGAQIIKDLKIKDDFDYKVIKKGYWIRGF